MHERVALKIFVCGRFGTIVPDNPVRSTEMSPQGSGVALSLLILISDYQARLWLRSGSANRTERVLPDGRLPCDGGDLGNSQCSANVALCRRSCGDIGLPVKKVCLA